MPGKRTRAGRLVILVGGPPQRRAVRADAIDRDQRARRAVAAEEELQRAALARRDREHVGAAARVPADGRRRRIDRRRACARRRAAPPRRPRAPSGMRISDATLAGQAGPARELVLVRVVERERRPVGRQRRDRPLQADLGLEAQVAVALDQHVHGRAHALAAQPAGRAHARVHAAHRRLLRRQRRDQRVGAPAPDRGARDRRRVRAAAAASERPAPPDRGPSPRVAAAARGLHRPAALFASRVRMRSPSSRATRSLGLKPERAPVGRERALALLALRVQIAEVLEDLRRRPARAAPACSR